MAVIRAKINPELLQWARKSAKLSLGEAAKKIDVKVDKLELWEKGEALPTIKQAKTAAHVYRRPLALFYMREVPQDFSPIADFRHLADSQESGLSYDLAILIRDIRERQAWVHDVMLEQGVGRLSFVASASVTDDPVKLAQNIRETIGIEEPSKLGFRRPEEYLRYWVNQTEDIGIFVIQTSKQGRVTPEVARGAAFADDLAPFIFVNPSDSYGARLFTVVHELAHIWLGESGISDVYLHGDDPRFRTIEIWCNRVASKTLLPDRSFQDYLDTLGNVGLETVLSNASKYFLVSRDVIARRLLDYQLIEQTKYDSLHRRFIKEWSESRSRKNSGGNYYRNHAGALSHAFVRLVASVYSGGRITGTEASGLLQTKLNKFPRLLEVAS